MAAYTYFKLWQGGPAELVDITNSKSIKGWTHYITEIKNSNIKKLSCKFQNMYIVISSEYYYLIKYIKASTYNGIDRVLSQYDQTIHANFKRVHNTYLNNHMEVFLTSFTIGNYECI